MTTQALAETAPALTLPALLDEIRTRRAEFEVLRHVPKDMVARLQEIGCYRAFVPARFGGDARTPAEFLRLIEAIATADASTGWVASFGVSSTYLAALPPETFAAIYGANPDTVFAGAMFPPQAATPDGDGFRVTGQWPWCSGSMGADLIGVGIRIEGESTPLPRSAILPAAEVEIMDTWHTLGLKATGSHDVRADGRHVREDWTFIRGGKPQMDDPIFRYPAMALAAQVLAVVALGTAREALDWLKTDAAQKASITGAPNPGTRPYIQSDLARAEAKLQGARAHFFDTTEEAWAELLTTGDCTPETRTHLRLVASQAAQDGAEAARIAFTMGGSNSMMAGHPLGRIMVDAACVAQHAFLNQGTWTSAGAAMFGQQTPPGYP